jgi:uncharacterized membrane protein
LQESPRMRALRAIAIAALLVLVLPATTALAQVSVDPTVTPEVNTGGWVFGMAVLLALLGLVVILLLVVAYVRFAPRFSTDESTLKVVRADRVRPGEELPRRTVDIKEAAPVVVAPPQLPEPAGVAAAAPAAAPAQAAPGQAAPAPAAPAAPAPAGPGAEAPSTEAPEAEPASEDAPAEADGATEARETPDAATSQAAPAPAPAEPVEVTMDQEVYEQTLQELLDKGTDKRVAEGQARRAGMIAARKKASGDA